MNADTAKLLLALSLATAGALPPAAAQEVTEPAEMPTPSADEWLDALAEEYWQRLVDESPALRIKEGLPVTDLPDVSFEHARETDRKSVV